MATPTKLDILTAMTAYLGGWKTPVVTYSFPTSTSAWTGYSPGSEPYRSEFRAFSAAEADMFRAALAAYDRYIALSFKEVQEPGASGDIRAAVTGNGGSGAAGWAYYPGQGPVYGDLWVDVRNGVNYELMLHELGHALGVAHPYDTAILPKEYRSWPYSILGNSIVRYVLTVSAQGEPLLTYVKAAEPMLYDVLVLQTLYGGDPDTGKGNTVYALNAPITLGQVLYDASGLDTIDASANTRSSTIDLEPGSFSSIGQFSAEDQASYYKALYPKIDWSMWLGGPNQLTLFTWTDNVSIAFGTIIENAIGGAANDVISGNSVANELKGLAGDDVLNGRDGIDVAVFIGVSSDYTWQKGQDGRWTVRDSRIGRDGVDTLENIEILRFSDKSAVLSVAFSQKVETAFASILRAGSGASVYAGFAADLQLKIYEGASDTAAVSAIVAAADATTSVALMNYQFFTGKIPSQVGIDFLISPTGSNKANLNSDYYAQFNVVNRYINFAVNLGKNGEGKDAFAAKYGAMSLFDATREAYKTIFGAAPTDATIHLMIDSRVDYFAYYGGDGSNGIGTKAAMVGWLLAEAEKADLGVMARSNNAWLIDIADGSAPFGVNILEPAQGYYKADFVFGGA